MASSTFPPQTLKIALTAAALLALLLATVLIGYLDLGWINIAANLLIALAKAALVAWVFMELSEVKGAIRLFALGVVAWIALMFVFTSADYFFREGL